MMDSMAQQNREEALGVSQAQPDQPQHYQIWKYYQNPSKAGAYLQLKLKVHRGVGNKLAAVSAFCYCAAYGRLGAFEA